MVKPFFHSFVHTPGKKISAHPLRSPLFLATSNKANKWHDPCFIYWMNEHSPGRKMLQLLMRSHSKACIFELNRKPTLCVRQLLFCLFSPHVGTKAGGKPHQRQILHR